MKTLAFSLSSFLAFSLFSQAAPNQVRVAWDVESNTNVTGYLVLYGTRSQLYSVTNVVNGRMNNTALLTNLPVGVVYVVAQCTGELNESTSAYSNEVLWTNAPPSLTPPRNVTLKAVIQASVSSNGPWSDLAWMKTSGQTGQVYRTVLTVEGSP